MPGLVKPAANERVSLREGEIRATLKPLSCNVIATIPG